MLRVECCIASGQTFYYTLSISAAFRLGKHNRLVLARTPQLGESLPPSSQRSLLFQHLSRLHECSQRPLSPSTPVRHSRRMLIGARIECPAEIKAFGKSLSPVGRGVAMPLSDLPHAPEHFRPLEASELNRHAACRESHASREEKDPPPGTPSYISGLGSSGLLHVSVASGG